jgi:alkylated DNA repair dioxygenase AlkB
LDLFDDLLSNAEPEVEKLLTGHSGQGCTATLHRKALSGDASHRLFLALHEDVQWQQRDVIVYGKKHLQPRLVAWFGDVGTPYTYAGLTLQPSTWTNPILEIKAACEELAGTRFNSVLLNLYRDGNDTVGWHSDDEPVLGSNPTIVSVSLGATRRFDLRHKQTKETVKVSLTSGSALVMAGRTQAAWSHQVPRTKKVMEPRINLTFRHVYHARNSEHRS